MTKLQDGIDYHYVSMLVYNVNFNFNQSTNIHKNTELLLLEAKFINKSAWIAITIGILLGIVSYLNEWLQNIIYPIMTVTHEMGHTVTGWLLAYPSIPYFDFRQGVGVTWHDQRNFTLFLCIYFIFAGLGWCYRRHLFILVILLLSVISYPWVTFSQLAQTLILLMGHGAELVLATLMWYLAFIKDSSWRVFYAMLGTFIVVYDLSFAQKLMYDTTYQTIYAYQGNGDFTRLAEMYFENQVTNLAYVFFWCCWLPPIVSFIIFYYQNSRKNIGYH